MSCHRQIINSLYAVFRAIEQFKRRIQGNKKSKHTLALINILNFYCITNEIILFSFGSVGKIIFFIL